MWRKILLLALLVLDTLNSPAFLLAQNQAVKFERIGVEQGLIDFGINCILQDRQGFIWIGAAGGLFRYDGYNFIVYGNDPFDSTSISDDHVLSIYEDRVGTLWIGTIRGLNEFNREKAIFRRFINDPKNSLSLIGNYYSEHDKA